MFLRIHVADSRAENSAHSSIQPLNMSVRLEFSGRHISGQARRSGHPTEQSDPSENPIIDRHNGRLGLEDLA